jgi:hypothetical protein
MATEPSMTVTRAVLAELERSKNDENRRSDALDAWAARVVTLIDQGAPDLEIEALIRHPAHRGVPAVELFRAGLRHVRGELSPDTSNRPGGSP